MIIDIDHPHIQEALKREQTTNISAFIRIREQIFMILDHANGPAKNSIIDEVELDLERHYESENPSEHITLHEKLSLKRLLEEGRAQR